MSLHVAIVSEQVVPHRGGAETSTSQFIEHLLERGLLVDLYTRARPPSTDRLRVHTIEDSGSIWAMQSRGFARQVDELLAEKHYDVVHAITPCLSADLYQPRGGTVPETVLRNLAMRQTRSARALKALANFCNLNLRSRIKLERDLLRRSPPPIVVAISDYVCRQVRQHYGLSSEQVRKIFNGVDYREPDAGQRTADRQAIRELYGIAEDEVLGLVVAHNFKLKGVAQWLQALQILRNRPGPRYKTIIIGKADPRPYYKLADALLIRPFVTFAGPTRKTTAFFHAADLLVHPTYYDPCSRVVLEGMLHGLPAVTTIFNGAAEVIDDGISGRVIESPDQITELAEAVAQIAQPSFRQALERMHEHLRQKLSMSRHADEMIQLYASIVRQR